MSDTLRLRQHAAHRAEHVALLDAEKGISIDYGALAAWVDEVESKLRDAGIDRGKRVALMAPSSVSTFVLLLACERLGAALLPLNWRLAAPELKAVVEHAKPHAIITAPPYDDVHFSLPVHLRWEEQALIQERARSAASPLSDDDIAMILFTSGTTGRPKGAMLPWRQVAVNALNTIDAIQLEPSSRVWSALPLFHTGGLNCLATPALFAGATTLLSSRFEPADALAVMERYQVTHLMGVPTMYAMLVEAGLESIDATALVAAICGGAPCPPSLIDRLHNAGIPFRQGYGLTEAGPNLFSLSPVQGHGRCGSVGCPAPRGAIRLAEDGEILVGGEHVMRGYLFDEETTANTLHDGFLRTGDIARVDKEGFYWIVGRKKEMFISGGENVFESEVELALAEHPAVGAAAVVSVDDAKWGQVGVAFLEPASPGTALATGEVQLWLRGRLAGYKVPKRWLVVAELPRTDSGKLTKVSLRERAQLDDAEENGEE